MVELIEAGYTKKTFGNKGGVKIHLEDHFKDSFGELEYLFIDHNGSRVPYYIENRAHDASFVILEDISSPEEALVLVNRTIFLEKELVEMPPQKELPYILGYTVFETNQGSEIGTIKSIEEYPQQLMLIVSTNSGDILIPFVEAFIESILPDEQLLKMNLPEGMVGQ